MTNLSNKVALVTGGSSGLGLATAEALARRGASVAIASRDTGKLERAIVRIRTAAKEFVNGGGTTPRVEAFTCDIAQLADLESLVWGVRAQLGPVDILVANGGGPTPKAASDLTEEDWAANWEKVFLFIPRLCRLVLPDMRQRQWGRILAIGSVSARQPIPGLALSNALRPAVVGYLKTLSQEVGREGITVNAVLPGYTATDRQVELSNAAAGRTGKSPDEVIAGWVGQTALGRMASPREIGEVVAFLASQEAAFVTGQALAADGGYLKGL
jgi:3-oxoacyl-[acyl-carrier protein] reductase